MNVRIEVNRGGEWKMRAEGAIDATVDQVAEQLPAYAIQYPRRLFVDGVLVAEVIKPRADRKAKVIRHDAN